jgi:hypothetical protein
MTRNEQNKEDAALDGLFRAAKDHDPVPNGELLRRILADAHLVQASFATPIMRKVERVGFFATLSEMIGGWAGASALTACVCFGLFLGFNAPDEVLSYAPGMESEIADSGFGFADLLSESSALVEG